MLSLAMQYKHTQSPLRPLQVYLSSLMLGLLVGLHRPQTSDMRTYEICCNLVMRQEISLQANKWFPCHYYESYSTCNNTSEDSEYKCPKSSCFKNIDLSKLKMGTLL